MCPGPIWGRATNRKDRSHTYIAHFFVDSSNKMHCLSNIHYGLCIGLFCRPNEYVYIEWPYTETHTTFDERRASYKAKSDTYVGITSCIRVSWGYFISINKLLNPAIYLNNIERFSSHLTQTHFASVTNTSRLGLFRETIALLTFRRIMRNTQITFASKTLVNYICRLKCKL